MPQTEDCTDAVGADAERVGRGVQFVVFAALVAAVAALAVPSIAASSPTRSDRALSSLESGVLRELNVTRAEHGLPPLRLNPRLTAAAGEHSREMGEDGYFEHTSHDGTAFWKRIDHWYSAGGYGFWSVGENLLWSSPEVDPTGALKLWMASPEHRANILTARWRDIGISAVHLAAAPGAYHDQPVTIITTDFGVRH
jgi:uncharacterized protein YkwD